MGRYPTPGHMRGNGKRRAIVSATGDLFDDFAVVRKIARAAIEAIAGRSGASDET